jgi:hypothetical protein
MFFGQRKVAKTGGQAQSKTTLRLPLNVAPLR